MKISSLWVLAALLVGCSGGGGTQDTAPRETRPAVSADTEPERHVFATYQELEAFFTEHEYTRVSGVLYCLRCGSTGKEN